MPKTKPPRRQRRPGDLPAGFQWRDGRPRWVPSPARRRQGWRGLDLKDAWAGWLAKGPAIARAEAICEVVAAWAAGQPVPSGFVAIAPKGSARAPGAGGAANPRSIGALLDAYLESPGFKGAGKIAGLAPRTQADYRSKLTVFLRTLAGPAPDAAKAAAKLAAVRALDIDVLLPPAFNEPGVFELERAYDALRETAGPAMAYGVLASVSAWLAWCVKKRRVWPTNPAALVARAAPDGRIVIFDWPELVALVRQAEALGFYSIADAIILAVDLSWGQQDLLSLTWGQISDDGHVRHRRIKTGVAGNPPLLSIGAARIKAIRARWAGQGVRPTHVLVCELPEVRPGQPWAADSFRHKFAEIRSLVAAQRPAVAAKQFRDLRDTAITFAYEAKLEVAEICSRTLHAPERAQAVIAKHYGAIRQGLTDEAGAQLDAHYQRMGYNFNDLLALPAPAKEG